MADGDRDPVMKPIPVEVDETILGFLSEQAPQHTYRVTHPEDERPWGALQDLTAWVSEDPDLWWRAIKAHLPDLRPSQVVVFAMGPVTALLRGGDVAWVRQLADEGKHDRRVAALVARALDFTGRAFVDKRGWPTLYELWGREFLAQSWLRHASAEILPAARLQEEDDDRMWDFWAWEMLDRLVYDAPDEAWEVILLAVQLAETTHQLGALGAGPLEVLLRTWGADYDEEAEARAVMDKAFATALIAVRR